MMPGQRDSNPAERDIPRSSPPHDAVHDRPLSSHGVESQSAPAAAAAAGSPGPPSSTSVPSGGSGNVAPAGNGASEDMGVSAFTAVSQYPNAVIRNNEPNNMLGVSEVINALIEERDRFFRQRQRNAPPHTHTTHSAGPADHHQLRSSSPPADLYISDSEMTDALADLGGVSLAPYMAGGDMEMDSIVQQLISNTANISSIAEDSEGGNLITDYDEPSICREDRSTLPSTPSFRDEDPDDTRKFYLDENDEEYEDSSRIAERDLHVSEADVDEFYQNADDDYSHPTDVVFPAHDDHVNYFSDSEDPAGELGTDAHIPSAGMHGTTYERNLTIDQFINSWIVQSSTAPLPNLLPVRTPLPLHPISSILGWIPPEKIVRPHGFPGGVYDLQQIPWWQMMRVKRSDARTVRDIGYTSYHNLEYLPQRNTARLPTVESYFREKSMHTKHKATIKHFQLRNLMSVVAHNTIHFAYESQLYSWAPYYDELNSLVDLSKPAPETGFYGPVKFTTMHSAHDVSIAGGFSGEYVVRAAGSEGDGATGLVTKDLNGITNHIDITPHRSNRSPMGVFASNDRHLRVLDCETNTWVSNHELSRAINCTSTSPDGRIRVVVGDSPEAWVIEADTGRPVHPLRGHRDFGFACAWSPDMRHIATSNQDKTVIIWDARMWRQLQKIESDVAGYRSVHFSPVGGGPRTLLLSEPADRISIVNAQTFASRQVHDFFGEVGGADYSPDGSSIWVANTDYHVGGFMEFERREWGQKVGPRDLPSEWVREAELDEDDRCVMSERERGMRFWWNLSDEEHEMLL